MSLKYASTPQVREGKRMGADGAPTAANDWKSRFPADARPISQAPTDCVVFALEASGQGCLAHFRSGQWRKLERYKDPRTAAVSLREDGTRVNDAVMFTMPRRG